MRRWRENRSAGREANQALWVVGSLLAAAAIGSATPFLLEGALEIFAVLLLTIIVVGVFQMPRTLHFDDTACWRLFLVSLTLFAVYPPYISIQISGLPWISPLRLAMALLLLSWLYALKVSSEIQNRIVLCVRSNRTIFILMAVFAASQVLSIPTSPNPTMALQKFLLFQLYWTFPFFAVISLVNTESRIRTFLVMVITFGIIQCLIGILEARQERLIWLDYLPPGFGADSELLTRIIQGTFRADGYRVQGSFSVSLLYAEFLVLVLPFALFALVDDRSLYLRIAGLCTAILILPCVYLSGSRLGMVGIIVVVLLFALFFVFRKWRENPRAMIGPFLVMMTPFGLLTFAALYMSSPRLRALTLGRGEHQASTDSRFEMWQMGIPKVMERPVFGYGSGLGAETLGFTNPGGSLSIDTYWLSALLEFGLVGALALLAMLAWTIHAGFLAYLRPDRNMNQLGGPIAVALVAFLIIKLVLSQSDNHLLVFVMIAMMVVIRTRMQASPALSAGAVQASPVVGSRQRRLRASMGAKSMPEPGALILPPGRLGSSDGRRPPRLARPRSGMQS